MKVGVENEKNEKNSKPKHIYLNFQLCFISFFFLITCLLLSEFEISCVVFFFFFFFFSFLSCFSNSFSIILSVFFYFFNNLQIARLQELSEIFSLHIVERIIIYF
jgi:pheromone shutdown protein TraB